MTNILLATHNDNKRDEIQVLLKSFKNVKIMNYDDLDVEPPIIVEDGKTFRQNAVKKAVTMSRFFDGLVLADDSGLEVDALGGKPGIRSARFSRKNATDDENNQKLLRLMHRIPEDRRQSRFVCVIALASNGILLDTFEGRVEGKILFEPKGESGFGYDPLFVPDGYEKTFAEMTSSYKNRISHRANALKGFKKSLKKYIVS